MKRSTNSRGKKVSNAKEPSNDGAWTSPRAKKSTGDIEERLEALKSPPKTVWVVVCGTECTKLPTHLDAMKKKSQLLETEHLDKLLIKEFPDETSANTYIEAKAAKDKETREYFTNIRKEFYPKELDPNDLPELNVGHYMTFSTPKKKRSSIVIEDDESATGDIVKQMKAQLKKQGMKIVIHHFPNLPSTAHVQPVVIEFQDTRDLFTHWLHRTEVWVGVIKFFDEECKVKNLISRFLKYLHDANLRKSNGEDIPETKVVKGGTLTLYHKGLYGYLQPDVDEEGIINVIQKAFNPVIHSADFQDCYKEQFAMQSRNPTAPDLVGSTLKNTTYGNNYWQMVQGAFESNIEAVPHKSLSQILQSSDIHNILNTILANHTTQDDIQYNNLPSDILKFAFDE